jgi:hypothetical protein
MNEDTITIQYGPGNSVTLSADKYPAVGDVLEDAALQSILGFTSGGVTASVNGVDACAGTPLTGGVVVRLFTKSHDKGLLG